jgi:hypothetical protein
MVKTLYITGKISEEELYTEIIECLKKKKEVKNIGTLNDVITRGDEEPYKIEIRKT